MADVVARHTKICASVIPFIPSLNHPEKIASLTLHIGKRQNFYRNEWQTMIKMRVTSFILALSLLCE